MFLFVYTASYKIEETFMYFEQFPICGHHWPDWLREIGNVTRKYFQNLVFYRLQSKSIEKALKIAKYITTTYFVASFRQNKIPVTAFRYIWIVSKKNCWLFVEFHVWVELDGCHSFFSAVVLLSPSQWLFRVYSAQPSIPLETFRPKKTRNNLLLLVPSRFTAR